MSDIIPAERLSRRPRHVHGKTVADGKARFSSVSALDLADTCLRKWWYGYVQGLKEPETEAQRRGTMLHGQVEDYLKTGTKALDAQVMRGLFMIPPPGHGLLIEHDLTRYWTGSGWSEPGLEHAPLRAGDLPIIGYMDLVHGRGENRGGSDIETTKDPDGTIEVIDWKFPRNLKYAKKTTELAKTTQMVGYAKWVFNVMPKTPFVRLSHGYMPSEGNARKVTALVDQEVIERGWEHPTTIARSIQHAAAEPDPDKIPANTDACFSYNKECMHKRYCSAGMHSGLASLIGITAAQRALNPEPQETQEMTLIPRTVLGQPAPVNHSAPGPGPANPGQGLLSLIKQQQAQVTPTVTSQPGTPAVQMTLAPPAVDPAEVARLAAAEKEAKRLAKIPPGFEANWNKILSWGKGYPALGGAAAEAMAALKDIALKDAHSGLSGAGELAGAMLMNADDLVTAIKELTEAFGEPGVVNTGAVGAGADPLGVLPPDAPASDPAHAADPLPDTSIVPTQSATQPVNPLASAVAQTEPKKRASKKKDETSTQPTQVVNVTNTVQSNEPAQTGMFIYVNAIPSCRFYRLGAAVDEVMDDLARLCSEREGKPIGHILLANPDGPLGFGRWKGAVHEYLTLKFSEEGRLGPGHFVLDVADPDVLKIATDVLRRICDKRGGVMVAGR